MILEQPSTAKRLQELTEAILVAFADVPQPARARIALHECEECSELRSAFAGRDWRTLSREFLEQYYGSLPLLSPEALQYYLPAYLLAAIAEFHHDNIVAEFTVCNLTPEVQDEGHADHLREKLRPFSAEQMRVLADFMQLVREDEEFRTYLGDVGPKHATLQELWRTRWD